MGSMSVFKTIRYESAHSIARITLDRPKVQNAFSPELRDEVSTALAAANRDESVRVIVVAGTEESRSFSSGHDINFDPPAGSSPHAWRQRQAAILEWEMTVWRVGKPVIAQVHGFCLGGACELIMFTDMVIASDDAQFGEPEIRFGAGPPALIMPWIIGIRRAKRLLMTGALIDARTACDWGMVDVVVPRAELAVETNRWAAKLARFPVEVMHYTKLAINRGMEAGGLWATLAMGTELNTQIEATQNEMSREFQLRKQRDGTKAALDWVSSVLDDPPSTSGR